MDAHDNELSHKRSENGKPTQASVKGSRHSQTSLLHHVLFEFFAAWWVEGKKRKLLVYKTSYNATIISLLCKYVVFVFIKTYRCLFSKLFCRATMFCWMGNGRVYGQVKKWKKRMLNGRGYSGSSLYRSMKLELSKWKCWFTFVKSWSKLLASFQTTSSSQIFSTLGTKLQRDAKKYTMYMTAPCSF